MEGEKNVHTIISTWGDTLSFLNDASDWGKVHKVLYSKTKWEVISESLTSILSHILLHYSQIKMPIHVPV